MERVTISMSDEFAADFAAFVETYRYENRSEALRDLARLGLERARIDHSAKGECFATLSYLYNHHTRDLAKRLTDIHHAHHDLHVATMHVHLDHESCLEVAVLRGKAAAVREFSKSVIAQRGVAHGQVSFVPVVLRTEAHPTSMASPGMITPMLIQSTEPSLQRTPNSSADPTHVLFGCQTL